MKHIVYILQSLASHRFYIGCTSDLQKRLQYHNSGKTSSAKPYRPWKIIYTETYSDKLEAYKREWFLKHPIGYREKRALVEKYGGFA